MIGSRNRRTGAQYLSFLIFALCRSVWMRQHLYELPYGDYPHHTRILANLHVVRMLCVYWPSLRVANRLPIVQVAPDNT